jgi:uncharacterized membrane protein
MESVDMDEARLAFGIVFVAAIGSGITAGIFFAFSSFVMPALQRIQSAQGVVAMKLIDTEVINFSFMGAFCGTGLLCVVLGVGSLFMWTHEGAKFVLVASLLYLVGRCGTTVVFNVPLNDKLARIADPTEAVSFWPEYVALWTRWNHVCTIASVASAALFTESLCLGS